MKILLTGGTGFIGSAFIRLAVQRGHQVMGLIGAGNPIPADLERVAQVIWEPGTLEDAPWGRIAAFGADVCIHAAWITTPGVYLESPENIRFLETSKIFLRKVRESQTPYIVGVGTCIEYRMTEEPLAEDTTPIEPSSTYAQCKNELRLALEQESRANGFPFAWTRIFYPYGVGEHHARLFSSIIQKLQRGETIRLNTPATIKDYIYIDDLAAALLTVVEKKFCGTINLGTGNGLSVREVAHCIGALTGRDSLIEEASPSAPDPYPRVVADASKLRSLGWSPAVDLKEGVSRLLAAAATQLKKNF